MGTPPRIVLSTRAFPPFGERPVFYSTGPHADLLTPPHSIVLMASSCGKFVFVNKINVGVWQLQADVQHYDVPGDPDSEKGMSMVCCGYS